MKNIFSQEDATEIINRINNLKANVTPQWGSMNVQQMLAHCNVTFEMEYETIHPKPNFFIKTILKLFVKKLVVNELPYKKNGQTAPQFIIKDTREFEKEKSRLIAYIKKTQVLGENYFDKKESHSFGVLTAKEWNNLFSKHIDHHLTQFGV
ncbi:MAG: DUF1569 domain-containing protein [Solirubrobacteraceae bacterium]